LVISKTIAYYLIFAWLILLSVELKAQNESDEKPLINVSNGISFKRDSLFLLNLRFRMQNRVAFNTKSGSDLELSSIEARIRRLRLRLDGFLLTPKLGYYIQLSFSKADQDLEEQEIPQIIRDGIVYYTFNKNFYVGFGQTKLPGNNERVVSSGNLQFADRSVTNAIFNIDRDFGLFGYYTGQLGDKSIVKIKTSVSSGDGRNASTIDNNLAYTGRIEILPFGSFKNSGDYSMGDLEREATPKLSLAATIHKNNDAIRLSGTRGLQLFESRDFNAFFADMVFKYKGFGIIGAYMNRRVDNPIIQDESGKSQHIYTGHGWNSQTSYIFASNWELAFRYSILNPSVAIQSVESQTEILDLGTTKYLNGHRVKLQSNIQYRLKNGNFNITNSGNRWGLVFQVEIGI
jgi:phosphate-selective porin OprO/OprP